MVAITTTAGEPGPSTPVESRAARRGRAGRRQWSRFWVLLLCGLYFVVPFACTFWFSIYNSRQGLSLSAYDGAFRAEGVAGSFFLSLRVAIETVVISTLLMVPTVLVVHLSAPRMRPVVETLCLMPLVIPPVALVIGIGDAISTSWATSGAVGSFVAFLQEGDTPLILSCTYVILAMPFTYRALDAGVRSIDAHTLVEAGRSLGAGSLTIAVRILAPSMRTAILNASFLAFALAFGEYAVATFLQYNVFSALIVRVGHIDGQEQTALTIMSLLITWVLLMVMDLLGSGRRSRRSRS